MGRTKKVGPTRGFGTRYGATVRKRYIKVATGLKRIYKCPRCGFLKVKRQSVGVWACRKCGFTFTGGAYTPTTKLGVVSRRTAKAAPTEEGTKSIAEEKSE